MKLRTIAAAIVALSAVALAKAQTNIIDVDLNRIEVDMTINPSEYRELLNRFIESDSTLTIEDVARLYYGQGFTFEYDPDQTFPLITDAYDRGDFTTAASLADAVLNENPLSLRLLVTGFIAAVKDNSPESIEMGYRMRWRLDRLVDTIIASGNGVSAATPFYVASTEDLRCFLRYILEVDNVLDTSLVGNGDVEAFKVRMPGSDRDHLLYFNNALQHRFDAQHKK